MTKNILVAASCVAALAIACGGAKGSEPGKRFSVEFRASTDDGETLGGVALTVGKRAVGTTSPAGALEVHLRGNEGATLLVQAKCPEGFVSSEKLVPLRLAERRAIESSELEPIPYEIICTRKLRDVVLVVHAENGAELPVSVDGRALGQTDPDGNAHVLLRLDRDVRSVSVSIDTSRSKGSRPQNPSRVFDLSGRDAVLLFEQTFSATPRTVATRSSSAKPRQHVPYRLD